MGTETIEGRECYLIEELDSSPSNRSWFDKEKLVVVKSDGHYEGDRMVSNYSDFRKIHGEWVIPYRKKTHMNGELSLTATVQSVRVNQGLRDNLFNPSRVRVD